MLRWLTIGLSVKFRGTCNPFDADPLQSVSVGFLAMADAFMQLSNS